MPFEPPQTTDELFGIQRSIFEKLSGVLGHPAISPSKGIGEALAGMVIPPTKEAAASSAMFSMMPATLSPSDIGKNLISGPLKEVVAEYKRLQSLRNSGHYIDNPARRVLAQEGKPMISSMSGGLDVINNPQISRMVEKGISPYVEGVAGSLRRDLGSDAYSLPFRGYPNKPVSEIWPDLLDKPEGPLHMPAMVMGRSNSPIDWLDTLFHEGAHLQYRQNPEALDAILRHAEPYYKHIPGYKEALQSTIINPGSYYFPYSTPLEQRFEESLASGIARSAVKTSTGKLTPFSLPQSLRNPIYNDYDLLDNLADMFYGR